MIDSFKGGAVGMEKRARIDFRGVKDEEGIGCRLEIGERS